MNNSKKLNNNPPSVTEILGAIPGVEVEQKEDADRLTVHVSRRAIPLRVVTRSSGYPRDVREAVWQAQERLGRRERLLVTAPFLAPGSREWLRSEGIAYVDAAGNLFLTADGVYIFCEKNPGRRLKTSDGLQTNIFRGRALQVLHTLLHMPERMWHVTDLAQEAGVAPGTALRVCETLEKMLLMTREGRGPQSVRRLSAPGKLLDAWAEEHQLRSYNVARFYRWHADLNDLALLIGKEVEAQGHPYAVTLALGAMHRAPFLTQTDQAALLVPQSADIQRLAGDSRLKAAEEGANVLLLRTKQDAPLMYRQKVEDLWIASDIQLCLDLNAFPMRGKEQAEHLRRERLGF